MVVGGAPDGPTPDSRPATTSSGRWVADRPMRCSRPAALRHQVAEPLEAEGEVGAPLVPGQGVDLVDDDRVDAAEHGPGRGRGEEQVERLGGGDQEVGR